MPRNDTNSGYSSMNEHEIPAYERVFIESTPRAEEMNEMMERTPSRLMRWGVLSIIGVIGLLLGIAFFVRYPDTLEGGAIITTNPLPVRLKASSSGRIVTLFVKDGQSISAGEPVAELQNNTGYAQIQSISAVTDSVQSFLQDGKNERLTRILAHPVPSLGEGQSYYNQLLQSISAYLLLKNEHIYGKRIGNLQQQIGRYKSVAAIASEETKLTKEELQQSADRFAANEKLYRDKVISKQEYYEEAAKLRQRQMTVESQRKSAVQNSITVGDNRGQLLDIEYDRREKERGLRIAIEEATRNLQNFIQTWKLQYLMAAPYSGVIHYLRPLQVSEPAASGDELFAVMPSTYHYTAQVQLPAAGLGKIRTGHKAHLLLAQFPYNEYGYLEGVVSHISRLPLKGAASATGAANEPMYLVGIELPDALVTSYHRPIPFYPEMAAQARIITKDRSLFQRLISGVAGK